MTLNTVGVIALVLTSGTAAQSFGEAGPDHIESPGSCMERLSTQSGEFQTPEDIEARKMLTCELRDYRLDKEVRPAASVMEPSKVFLLPHVFQRTPSEDATKGSLAVEVEFNETFYPYQNVPTATDRYFGGLTTKFGITPMYRVRIWKEHSAPVRTPSFMPKGTYFFEALEKRAPGVQWGEKAVSEGPHGRPSPKRIVTHTFTVAIGHHSNGQDGCLFAPKGDEKPYSNENCPTDLEPSQVRINRFNGSFSTNYAEGSYSIRLLSLAHAGWKTAGRNCVLKTDKYDLDCDGYDDRYDIKAPLPGVWDWERRARSSWLFGVTYQWNPPFDTFGGALEKPVRPIYGMNRFRFSATHEKYWGERGYTGRETGRFFPRIWQRFTENGYKVRAWAELTDKSNNAADCVVEGPRLAEPICAPRFSWGVDLTIGLFSKADGLGLYSRFLQAQDYYNLSFTQRKDNQFQTGLSFSLGRSRGPAFPVIADPRLREEERIAKKYNGGWQAYRDDVIAGLKEKWYDLDR